MVIQYINDHAGVPCTSACAPNGPGTGGEWTLEVLCNPTNTRPGWVEFRAHFPGETSTVNGIGVSYRGCAFGGNPAGGTISQFCPTGNLFDAPMEFWVQRSGGTLDRHTFDNPGALLNSTCPKARTVPGIKVLASCNSTFAGTYDLDIVYYPPEFPIYAIYDEAGRVLTQCGTCADGHCHCDGVPVSADGMIHINVDDRNGPEVMYPQVIAPPSCDNTSVGGWGFSANCDPSNPNFINCAITFPTTLGIYPAVINTRPGWMAWMPDISGTGNTILCGFERSNIGTLPFTWEFMGPAPDYSSIYHTFAEFPGVIPTVEECSGNIPPSGWRMDMVCTPWLASHFPAGFIGFQIHYPSDITLNLFGEVAGHVNLGCYYAHNEPEHYIQFACPGTWGTDPIWVLARDTHGTVYQLSFPVTTAPSGVCAGTTPTGWSFTPPACVEGGGSIEFNVDHPSSLNITAASGQNLTVTYGCGIVNPTRLFCMGRASTSLATLTINYTLADGTTGSVDFGTIAAVTPSFCPTPCAPSGGGQTGCSQ